MESLQLYYSLLCVLIFSIACYYTSKRYQFLVAFAFSVTLYVLPVVHHWHIIWGANFVFELCNADDTVLFAWTECIGKDFSTVFLNSYEITGFFVVALLRSGAIYLCVQRRGSTMNYQLRLAWMYLIVLNAICICLSVLLWVLPGVVLLSYVFPYNVLALMLSVLIIYVFASVPTLLFKPVDEEEIPLNKITIESLSDSEI